MKIMKIAFAAAAAFAFGNAYAFHSGGVAECNGCHTMHNSLEGAPADDNMPQYASGPYLLKGNDQSSACLNCHSTSLAAGVAPRSTGYYVLDKSWGEENVAVGTESTDWPGSFNPGGDFGWLKKNYTWTPRPGTTEVSKGERHGHNVIAADFLLGAEPTAAMQAAPGGSYPAGSLNCIACHDPHGKYRRNVDGSQTTTGLPIIGSGSYNTSKDPTTWGSVGVFRLLAGAGYQPKSNLGYAFANGAPDAVVNSAYNRPETTGTDQVITAYGQGMSEWCANCHTAMHMSTYTTGQAGLVHPAGNGAKLPAAIATNYNSYVKSGDLTGANAYSSLVPFELGTAVYADLKAVAAGTTVPVADGGNVSCLSCHRAHASGFDSMLRWSLAYEFVTTADASGNPRYGSAAAAGEAAYAQGKAAAEYQQAMYGRPATQFAPYQRVLCNKCHAKD